MIQLTSRNGLSYFHFSALDRVPGLFHGYFTAQADSHGVRLDFNVATGSGKTDDRAGRHRRWLADTVGVDRMIYLHQVHGSKIHLAGPVTGNGTSEMKLAPHPTADAVVTDQLDVALVIQVADCQPVVLADPVRRVVANVHAGWRGSVQDVLGLAVQKMKASYGCRPEDIWAGIGPSLGPCCAEFVHYRRELPEAFWAYKDDHHRFDFWRISAAQLHRAGVTHRKILISGVCTRCNPGLLYSYRGRTGDGRLAAVVGMVTSTSDRKP